MGVRVGLTSLILGILLSSQAASAGGRADRESSDRTESRAIAALFSSATDSETLKCTPRCDGHKGCSRHKNLETCVSDSSSRGCFWSCEQ